MAVRHPARYTPVILDKMEEIIARAYGAHDLISILDPFAGVGTIHQLRDRHPEWVTVGVELEPEWATQHPFTIVGDATKLSFFDNLVDVIATSPCYGNRMADNYAGDGTRRHTYRISLGRPLTDNSAAGMQWGAAYRNLHTAAWAEAERVLKPGGMFLLNISDHIRDGEMVPVSHWHVSALSRLGLNLVGWHPINTPRQREGANGDLRAPCEWVFHFTKGTQ